MMMRPDDPYLLHSSHHPGMALVSAPLTGSNYQSWRRAMTIALGAMTKLGFIDGRIKRPVLDAPEFDQLRKVDITIYSWILNSLSKDLVDAFLYADSAQDLWEEIEQRFGESYGPRLYRLQKEISNIRQENDSIAGYFTRLKRIWDEYASLMPLPTCKCGSLQQMVKMEEDRKLFQFLMGLNESYEGAMSQILLQDPLPSPNMAYSLVQRVEKQRQVHQFPENLEQSAMFTRGAGFNGRGVGNVNSLNSTWQGGRGKGAGRLTKEEKAKLKCEYCQGNGHLTQSCFKLHGYPDWFKTLKEDKAKLSGKVSVNSANFTKRM